MSRRDSPLFSDDPGCLSVRILRSSNASLHDRRHQTQCLRHPLPGPGGIREFHFFSVTSRVRFLSLRPPANPERSLLSMRLETAPPFGWRAGDCCELGGGRTGGTAAAFADHRLSRWRRRDSPARGMAGAESADGRCDRVGAARREAAFRLDDSGEGYRPRPGAGKLCGDSLGHRLGRLIQGCHDQRAKKLDK